VDLRTIAIADNGSYLLAGPEGRCCLFTVEAGPHAELGDLLQGGFEPCHAPQHAACNLTQGQDVVLRFQHWDPAPFPAISCFLHEALPHPRVIFTASRRLLAAAAAAAARHLCDQMSAFPA
jgi:hypothetical protein